MAIGQKLRPLLLQRAGVRNKICLCLCEQLQQPALLGTLAGQLKPKLLGLLVCCCRCYCRFRRCCMAIGQKLRPLLLPCAGVRNEICLCLREQLQQPALLGTLAGQLKPKVLDLARICGDL